MEALQPILIPCLFITLAVQDLIPPQKTHFHASTQTTIRHLTSILTSLLILMRYHLYLISTPTSLTETIPVLQEEPTMIPIGDQYLAQLSRAQVKNGLENLTQ